LNEHLRIGMTDQIVTRKSLVPVIGVTSPAFTAFYRFLHIVIGIFIVKL
jgi:hypothetical protein